KEENFAALEMFYTGYNNKFKRCEWDAQKAFREEYHILADGLLRMIDGSVGRRSKDNKNNKALDLDSSSQNKASHLCMTSSLISF
ncbi:hypothetical protein BGZ65_011209, partial [Modicella reniformis]